MARASRAWQRPGMPPFALCALAEDEHAPDVVAVGRELSAQGGFTARYIHVMRWYVAPLDADEPTTAPRARLASEHRLPCEAVELHAGPVALEVQRRADELGAALVVVGSGIRGRVEAALTGSVFRSLLRHGDRPVVVAHGVDALTSPGPVVCAITAPERRAARLARTAAGLARRLDRPLLLAACDGTLDDAARERIAVWQHVPAGVRHLVAAGPRERALPALAARHDAALLVAGSRRGGLLDRRVAPRRLRAAPCPTVIVPVAEDRAR
jgi:nucleotide-binding universal stress UspA family protein